MPEQSRATNVGLDAAEFNLRRLAILAKDAAENIGHAAHLRDVHNARFQMVFPTGKDQEAVGRCHTTNICDDLQRALDLIEPWAKKLAAVRQAHEADQRRAV